MRVVVLGGAGFMGVPVCRRLVAEGHDVTVFDRNAVERAGSVDSLGVRNLRGDFTDEAKVAEALDHQDAAIHLVSTTIPSTSNAAPAFDVQSNLVSTIHMLEAARRHDVSQIVFASSGGAVYGSPEKTPIPETHATNPTSSYGIVKLAIEKYLHYYREMYGLDYVVLRPANAYGEGQKLNRPQGAVGHFANTVVQGKTVSVWGDGTVVRDHVYVEDVAAAFSMALNRSGSHRVFNVGSGQGTSINQLFNLLEEIVGRRIDRRYLPGRPFDVRTNVLDISRARIELGWRPTMPLKEGIRRTVAHLASLHGNALGTPSVP